MIQAWVNAWDSLSDRLRLFVCSVALVHILMVNDISQSVSLWLKCLTISMRPTFSELSALMSRY